MRFATETIRHRARVRLDSREEAQVVASITEASSPGDTQKRVQSERAGRVNRALQEPFASVMKCPTGTGVDDLADRVQRT